MSIYDQYAELELYLQQTEKEISEIFENNQIDLDFSSSSTASSKDPEKDLEDKEIDNFLFNMIESIKSDVNELHNRYELEHNFDEKHFIEGLDILMKCKLEDLERFEDLNGICNLDKETDILSDIASNESLDNSLNTENAVINATTQTSPSLSPSSTNLTWASECMSSPCLTSASDNDDAQSTSSNDRSTQSTWGTRFQKTVLRGKSSSAPLLKRLSFKVNKQTRSQSDRHLTEIEAAEACKWLRATGFPQYAQMYEDMQFPVDIDIAAKDHPLLEPDVLNSLFRRLRILNNCMHLHQQRAATHTDESEDENCALSSNWTFQSDIRRWSRACNDMSNPTDNVGSENTVDTDEVFGESAKEETPRNNILQEGFSKFRRRREGVVISESGSKLLDSLSEQLSGITATMRKPEPPKFYTALFPKPFDKIDTTENETTSNTEPTAAGARHSPENSLTNDEPYDVIEGRPISEFSSMQLQVLRKLALLKLTAHLEKYCPSHKTGWNWDFPKFIKKTKTPGYKDKFVFGVPISIMLQRSAHPMPRNIEEALQWLEQNSAHQVGLFRKSGVKSRIQALRNVIDTHTELINFNDQQAYDVADMIKQYFRELPEALLTNKLSETFILIFQYIPRILRRDAILCAVLLMPDEHVEVLQALIIFLVSIANHSSVNQMNESNLATCFAPSLFHYPQVIKSNLGSPHPKDLADNKAAHECLMYFMTYHKTVFTIPADFLNQCSSNEISEYKPKELSSLESDIGGWKEYLTESQNALVKEATERPRGWMSVQSHNPRIEMYYKKVEDNIPLRLWKICADIDAPPSEVAHRILRERHIWDPELMTAKIVVQVDNNTEIFQYSRKRINPMPSEEYCVVRNWRTDLPRDSCLIVETSVEHKESIPTPRAVRGIVFASRYRIEPCGSGRSRLLHLCRTDTMGKSPDWNHKNYGHICAFFIGNLQNSFYQKAGGPESRV